MDKLIVATEYIPQDGGAPLTSDHLPHFLNRARLRFDVHVVNPRDNRITEEGTVVALNDSTGEEEVLDVSEVRGVYFGLIGQSMKTLDTSLATAYKELTAFFDSLAEHNPGSVNINDPNTMLHFASKRYLLSIPGDIPHIETMEVSSLDELLGLREVGKFVAKPIVSERANGTVILGDLMPGEVVDYFNRYCGPEAQTFDPRIGRQGIIVQPYDPEFMTDGEVKIAVIGGKVMLTRKFNYVGEQDADRIVAFDKSVVHIMEHQPTDAETELALRVFHYVNDELGMSSYTMRVDLAGGKVSEIEAVNPSFSYGRMHPTREGFMYARDKVHAQCDRILDGFVDQP